LCRLLDKKPVGSQADIAVIACSKGAEVYSIAWAIHSARPDFKLKIDAVDISQEILNFASSGTYSFENPNQKGHQAVRDEETVARNTSRDQENAWMFERMSSEEIAAMFEVTDSHAIIRPYLREGITWIHGDANNPQLQKAIGRHEIVFANRFLCHMKPDAATACLRNLATLVKPGGYLFVYGVDLEVRTKVALEMGWQPVPQLLREIHDGDDSLLNAWPLQYWGLEPLDDTLPDWQLRYASVFRVGESVPSEVLTLAGKESAGT
jgi:chemotaxis methyl-accepting protein methylase